MSTRKWLLTAFEPFDGEPVNSSQILVELIEASKTKLDFDVNSKIPVTYSDSWPTLQMVLKNKAYSGVLAFGQSAGRECISLERVALNWIDSLTPDNAGQVHCNVPVVEGAPEVLWSRIPWETFEPSSLIKRSYSAGTYVCNHLFYQLLYAHLKNPVLCGFVHVPRIENEQHKIQLMKAIYQILTFVADHDGD